MTSYHQSVKLSLFGIKLKSLALDSVRTESLQFGTNTKSLEQSLLIKILFTPIKSWGWLASNSNRALEL